jgi:hypothetical protein
MKTVRLTAALIIALGVAACSAASPTAPSLSAEDSAAAMESSAEGTGFIGGGAR